VETVIAVFALLFLLFVGLGAYATVKAVGAAKRGVDRTIEQARRTVEDHTLRAKSFAQVGPAGEIAQLRLTLRTSMRATQDALHAGAAADGVRVVHADAHRVVLEVDGVQRRFDVARYGDEVYVDSARLTALPRFPDPAAQLAPGSLVAPMPGTVVRVAEGLEEGAAVQAGQPLIWLEAMKMQHQISAPVTGVLSSLQAKTGQQVEPGTLLAVVQEPSS
jgi:biotin carboxyl carrier protein